MKQSSFGFVPIMASLVKTNQEAIRPENKTFQAELSIYRYELNKVAKFGIFAIA